MNKLLSTLALALIANATIAGQSIDQQLQAAANGRVLIDNMRGHITVEGWDKNLVKVSGELDDAAEGYEFERHGDRIVFEVNIPRRKAKGGEGSKLHFYLPHNSSLNAEGVNVEFHIKGVYGGTRLETINGNIEAEALKQDIELETINGNIRSRNLDGRIEMSTVNGRIDDQNSSGKLELSTVNGPISSNNEAEFIEVQSINSEIKLELLKIKELGVKTANARIDVILQEFLPRGDINIDTVSGRVELKLPEDISADISLQNHAGGHIHNGLSEHQPERPRFGPGRSLDFSLNGGSGNIDITSVSADVDLNPKK
ncbi:MAG: hypothetical protein OIF38_15915 [Cellvibrionaceae bacterium]|nr:hypothetical protein [Cellvibrionaceae bacterium]